jgi:glutamine amidotransferase-like uncharacterized protein
MNETAKLALFVALVMLVLSGAIYTSSYFKKTGTEGQMLSLVPDRVVVTDPVTGALISSSLKTKDLAECCPQKIINDTTASLINTFSSSFTDKNFLRRTKLEPGAILVADAVGNVSSSQIGIPFITSCCESIKALIDDVAPKSDGIYSSLKTDATYVKKPETSVSQRPVTYNAYTGALEMVSLPANSILSTDTNGDIVTTPYSLPSCCDKIKDTIVDYTTTFSSNYIDTNYQRRAVAGSQHLVMMDDYGNLVDSGLTPTIVNTCCETARNALSPSNIIDGGGNALYSAPKIDATFQKKTTAPANALLMPDANGNLVDSGLTPAAIQACCTQAANAATDSLLKSDIVDTSLSATKLYSSLKIDDTFQKKAIAPANAIVVVDAKGDLVDSGFTPQFLQNCCAQAATGSANGLMKADIVDTSTATDKLYSSSKIDTTYQKKTTAPANAILMPDANGNLVDSGLTPLAITTCCTAAMKAANESLKIVDIVDTSTATDKLYSSSKIDMTYQKKTTAPANSLLMPDANGNLVDSGLTPSAIQACCTQAVGAATNSLLKTDIVDTSTSTDKLYSSSKIDTTYQKKTTAPANSLLMPDANGNLVDSGLTPTAIQACCTQAVSAATNSLLKTDIVDTSTSTDKLYSSSKIEATFTKKTTAPANVLLMPDANGNLVDSGITPAFISACCQETADAKIGVANALLKSDIVDTSTAATKLYSSSKIDATYQKKTTAPANSLLMPDANGNLVDSGLTPTAIQACCTQAVSAATNSLLKTDIVDTSTSTNKLYSSSKIDATYSKKTTAPANSLLMPDANGNLVDSGLTPAGIQACCTQAVSAATNSLLKTDIIDTTTSTDKLYSSSKIDATYQKKTTAPANVLLMPDASGNLVDSGITPAFISACCQQTTNATTAVANALLKSDIVDTSTSTSKLYSSSKIDATYAKKPTAPANAILVPDANGNLVDSGLTPTAIQACCTQAVNAATNSLLKTDIVDTSTSATKLYSSAKIDATYTKKTTAPANALLMPDASGNLVDSGLTPAGIQACCTQAASAASNSLLKTDIIDTSTSTTKLYSSSKIDATYQKKTTAPANALLMPDASGNLVDSGITPAFINACCQQTTSATTAVANALLKSDIVDTSTSATKLYSSSKIDATYAKKPTAPANALLMPDANGNLVDSGLTPAGIQACCTQAASAAANSLLKTDIIDTSTSATKLYSSAKIDATYTKKTTAPANALLMPDANGNLVDSGLTPTAIQACCTQAVNAATNSLLKTDIIDTSTSTSKLYSSSKIDATYTKKTTAPANAILVPDANGNLVDSGLTPAGIQACCTQAATAASNSLLKTDIVDTSTSATKLYSSSKIDATYQKKTTAPANALLMPDASGNLVDSGITPAFISACCQQTTNATTAVANALLKSDIVDTSTSASKLYSSSKIDATYAKKPTAPANALLMPDANGNLVDSGLTPAGIQACCTQAATAATNSLLKTDIIDTSTSTSKLYSSSKIDATYTKKTTAPANALLMPDASGNLVDSGLTPTFINACCTQASNALAAATNSLVKTDIVDTSTATTKLYSSSKIDATYQKKTTAPANALLMPDASGNLVDSGLTKTSIEACCTQAANVASNSLLKTDIVDTSTSATKLYSSSKIDATYTKKTTAPANALLMPDANGNLVDSGLTPTFINACCTQASNALTAATNSLLKTDIVDTSTATTKLYSSSKIDATYQKKTTAPANALLMPDASGNLVDSGLTPTFIKACCTQASDALTATNNVLLKSDIKDSGILGAPSTTSLWSSSKIDTTFQKKSTAAPNTLLVLDTNGNLVSSGLTPTQIETCCATSNQAVSSATLLYLQYTNVFAYFNAVANTWTLAAYFTKRYDTTGGWYANGKFQPKQAGVWSIRATAWAPRTLGGNRIHFCLAQNAAMSPLWQDVNSWNNLTQSNITTFTAKVDAIFVLNGSTDYVAAYFMTNSLPQDFDVLENCNMFQAYYLGGA